MKTFESQTKEKLFNQLVKKTDELPQAVREKVLIHGQDKFIHTVLTHAIESGIELVKDIELLFEIMAINEIDGQGMPSWMKDILKQDNLIGEHKMQKITFKLEQNAPWEVFNELP